MRAGRPLSFHPDQALEAATAAFWENGFEASSMQQLLTATGLSKSSLYQQFGSKPQLFEKCLEHYARTRTALLEHLLAQAPSGRVFIQMVMQQIVRETQPAWGCLLFNTATEFGQSNPQVGECVAAGLGQTRNVFLKALQQDQEAGLIAAESDLEALADFVMTNIGGLRAMVKMGTDPAALEKTIALILDTLK